jgi:hypothetical protein
MNESSSYDDSRAEIFGNEESPFGNANASVPSSEDREPSCWSILVRAQFSCSIKTRLTKQRSDTNDEDGRNADAYATVIIVLCLTGRHAGFDELKEKSVENSCFCVFLRQLTAILLSQEAKDYHCRRRAN